MSPIANAKHRVAHLLQKTFPRVAAFREFPASPTPRYGWGRPPNAPFYNACEEQRARIQAMLESFLQFKERILSIRRRSENDSVSPVWDNPMFPGLDAISLYCMLSVHRPAQYFEIGAGHSTRFARRAITDGALRTSITCIDPAPRLSVQAVADHIVTSGLESVDLGLFDSLNAGDILFVDGSHRAFMHSDVTVVFLEILPTLKPGVLVHFHDIHLPYDYPPEWGHLYYNEQYLLGAYVLGGRLGVVLPNAFITRDAQLHGILEPVWTAPSLKGVATYGGSFWGIIR